MGRSAKTDRRPSGARRGYAMPTVLFVVGLVFFLALFMAQDAATELSGAREMAASARAMYAAEAGLEWSLAELKKDPKRTFKEVEKTLALKGGKFTVNSYGAGSEAREVPPGCLLLESVGVESAGATRTAVAVIRLGTGPNSLLSQGLLANKIVLNDGSRISGFSSPSRAWTMWGYAAANPLVATNRKERGTIRLLGGSQVEGMVAIGKGGKSGEAGLSQPTFGQAHVVWKDWVSFHQGERVLAAPLKKPPVPSAKTGNKDLQADFEGITVEPGSYRKLVLLEGGKATLSAGEHVFAKVVLGKGARLVAEPGARLVVTQLFKSAGESKVNYPGKARDLVISLAGQASADLEQTQAAAVFYGPGATMKLRASYLEGAVICRSFDMSQGSSLIYDEFLDRQPPELGVKAPQRSAGFGRTSWERLR